MRQITKEMIIDFSRNQRDHGETEIEGETVERVKSYKHTAFDNIWKYVDATVSQQFILLQKAHITFIQLLLTVF